MAVRMQRPPRNWNANENNGSVENPTSEKGTIAAMVPGTFLLRGLRKNEPVPGGVCNRYPHNGFRSAQNCTEFCALLWPAKPRISRLVAPESAQN
jgi:hypothetical protein